MTLTITSAFLLRMMNKRSGCLLLIFLFFLCGCASTQPQSSSDSTSGMQEDLSKYRPVYQKQDSATPKENTSSSIVKQTSTTKVIPQNDITKALNAKMDSIAIKNQKFKYAQGYRVIVYSGNSSEEAKQAKEKVYEILPNADIYTVYKQPSFRVKVGDCFDRLEANSLYIKLKNDFANALVVPDQINIIKEQQ